MNKYQYNPVALEEKTPVISAHQRGNIRQIIATFSHTPVTQTKSRQKAIISNLTLQNQAMFSGIPSFFFQRASNVVNLPPVEQIHQFSAPCPKSDPLLCLPPTEILYR